MKQSIHCLIKVLKIISFPFAKAGCIWLKCMHTECLSADLHVKLETEKSMRHKVEARLLETEKKNSEMGVDLMQLQQRVGTLQSQLQTEMDKVSRWCHGRRGGDGRRG